MYLVDQVLPVTDAPSTHYNQENDASAKDIIAPEIKYTSDIYSGTGSFETYLDCIDHHAPYCGKSVFSRLIFWTRFIFNISVINTCRSEEQHMKEQHSDMLKVTSSVYHVYVGLFSNIKTDIGNR